ncbi:MAG: polysaccharide deacetylase family protein [Clostridia bacterium]|nr:polysaccharide deacetylase family protein [Clostridia bacterium]
MYIRFKDGKRKALTLSYDDGVVQDIRLSDIMKKNGIKGTFNINSGTYLDEEAVREKYYGRMKLSEAKALYTNSGNEVAVHAYTHPRLELLDTTEILSEVIEDRKSIEKEYGTIARGMAYPFGTYSDKVVEALKMCGICYSRTTKATESFGLPENWLTLDPTCHHNNPRLMELAKQFVEEEPRWGGVWMFYLWGHSYEFDNNDNWNVIEEFCEYMGGRDDIWYATNIEIYDYVKAYENLQTSVDKKIIHNPSNTDVWAEHNGKVIKIKAGETVTLDD